MSWDTVTLSRYPNAKSISQSVRYVVIGFRIMYLYTHHQYSYPTRVNNKRKRIFNLTSMSPVAFLGEVFFSNANLPSTHNVIQKGLWLYSSCIHWTGVVVY